MPDLSESRLRGQHLNTESCPHGRVDFDVPIVLQDRTFKTDGGLAYDDNNPSNIFSQAGATLLVKRHGPAALPGGGQALAAPHRQRRGLEFVPTALSSSQRMVQIATDGGLLDRPVAVDVLVLGSAERAEVVVDFGAWRWG
ncbi:MAG: hypothetical protein M3256_09795 [Actinomycetota bacterium]|nr:hypothetical protein [Actinomycetota bacterium]